VLVPVAVWGFRYLQRAPSFSHVVPSEHVDHVSTVQHYPPVAAQARKAQLEQQRNGPSMRNDASVTAAQTTAQRQSFAATAAQLCVRSDASVGP
jgi:hypothetical protein